MALKKKPKHIGETVSLEVPVGNPHLSPYTPPPAELVRVLRRYDVVDLRKKGWSIRAIAEHLGVGINTVSLDLDVLYNEVIAHSNESAEISRQLQIERLDDLIRTYMPLATEGWTEKQIDPATNTEILVQQPPSPAYAQLILNIEARRAKLIGLDKPEKKELEITGIREYVGVRIEDV